MNARTCSAAQAVPSLVDLNRRALLIGGVAGATAMLANSAIAQTCHVTAVIENISRMNAIGVSRVVELRDRDDLRQAVRRHQGPISIGGGRYSMGGQTALACGTQLDMRALTSVLEFNPGQRRIRVHAGARWRQLQSLIDPHGLSIRTMQSFSNFTVGGSISVNCHGRYVGHGAIAESIEAITLCLANGEFVEASRGRNHELFAAAIGGYGALGIIVDVTLRLDENEKITREFRSMPLGEYFEWVRSGVLTNGNAVMHNADLVPGAWKMARSITWRRATPDAPLTVTTKLQESKTNYFADRAVVNALTSSQLGQRIRPSLQDARNEQPQTIWRNYEASLDLRSLEPFSRKQNTFVLEEYFVPEKSAFSFALKLVEILERNAGGTVNVSIRHASRDDLSLFAWARESVFSFVLYIRIDARAHAQSVQARWTRALIDLALSHKGTYYLPYLLHASQEQFDRAYPRAHELKRLRAETSGERFSNELWNKYL
jgi:FAD/FMN-containing dehydrogenase